ncbi:carboxypeptidase C prc1 [Thoreauomyces humboldtii]|nr:carboxypeptidase C prc1 [Thoreauomyces humboldtii]
MAGNEGRFINDFRGGVADRPNVEFEPYRDERTGEATSSYIPTVSDAATFALPPVGPVATGRQAELSSLLAAASDRLCELTRLFLDAPEESDEAYSQLLQTRVESVRAFLDPLESAVLTGQAIERQIGAECFELESSIHEKSQILGEPRDELPSSSSFFARRSQLSAMTAQLEETIAERTARLNELRARWEELRSNLGDLDESEFAMPSQGLSLRALDATMQIVRALEDERAQRILTATAAVSDLRELCRELKRPVPDSATSALGLSTSQCLDVICSHALWENSAAPIAPTRALIHSIKTAHQQVKEEYEALMAQVDAAIKEITVAWDQLDVPEVERRTLPRDLDLLDEYKQVAFELNARWRVKMEKAVDELYARLKILWDRCHLAETERDTHGYDAALPQNAPQPTFYTPATLDAITAEVERLEARYERFREIYAMLEARENLVTRMVAFEKTASDPARLFRPSFQLMEEDRYRKSAYPNLLKAEQGIRDAVTKVESAYPDAGTVMWNGEPVKEFLKREAEGRFVNATVFVLDGTSHGAGKPSSKMLEKRTVANAGARSAMSPQHQKQHRRASPAAAAEPAFHTPLRIPSSSQSAKYRTLTPPSACLNSPGHTSPPLAAGRSGVANATAARGAPRLPRSRPTSARSPDKNIL